MAAKRIEFSAHCEKRLAENGITRQTVRKLIATGERVPTGRGRFNVVGGSARFRLAGRVHTRKAIVGCFEGAERILVRSLIPVVTPRELADVHELRRKAKGER